MNPTHSDGNDRSDAGRPHHMPIDDLRLILDRLGVAANSDKQLRSAMQQFASWLGEVSGTELRFDHDAKHRPGRDDRDRHDDHRDWFGELRSVVPRRARLKAECCRWVPRREAHLDGDEAQQAEAGRIDREFIDRARAMPYCYLWMLDGNHGIPEDMEPEDLAGCFETLAEASELLLDMLDADAADDRDLLEKTLFLLAESVSAARFLVIKANNRPDPDVDAAFQCLRQLTRQRHIYIPRHMRVDDPADPTVWRDRQERIDAMYKHVDSFVDRRQNARQHVDVLQDAAGKAASGDSTALTTLDQAARELIELDDRPAIGEALGETIRDAADEFDDDNVPAGLADLILFLDRDESTPISADTDDKPAAMPARDTSDAKQV